MSAKKPAPKWGIVAASILLCQGIGFLGAYFTTPAIPTWYATLIKPWFSPPNWIFAPVWTILYLLMGIALARIWSLGPQKTAARYSLVIFFIQLVFNFSWSVVFFGMQNPAAALVVIFVMWVFIIATIIAFKKLDRLAAYLLVPYLAWVSFATLLNAAVWVLNY